MSSKIQNNKTNRHSHPNKIQVDDKRHKTSSTINSSGKSLSFLDVVAYVLMPGPMILFYPLIVAMALQNNCIHYLNKIYLVLACFILNMFMLPILVPISIFIGSMFGFLMFPMMFCVYALIFISDKMGISSPLKGYVDNIKTIVPKFNVEYDDDELTEEYLDE